MDPASSAVDDSSPDACVAPLLDESFSITALDKSSEEIFNTFSSRQQNLRDNKVLETTKS